ncbi:MAG: VOC family protein [Actinobacteria bacterium]|nr:VOC family protein [Actinomycetota bacterium]
MTDAVPTASFHHTALVVSSLDDSIAFYQRCFGGELEAVLRDTGGPEIAALHGLDEARFDLAFIPYGGAVLELFQFHEPASPERVPTQANRIGDSHVAFEVDDVEAAYRRLLALGLEFPRPPLRVQEGDAAGFDLVFTSDPDGNRIELIAPPPPEPRPRPAMVVNLRIAAERREEFLELIAAVGAATAAEAGSEEWVLHESSEDPASFWLYERYADDDAAALHHDQPQLQNLLSKLGDLVSEPPLIVDLTTR